MKILLFWFKVNSLKANPGKFQFMILTRKQYDTQEMLINTITVKETNEVKLLGIAIDKSLSFKNHIDNLCRTANYKLHALRRIRKHLTLEKAKLLGSSFIESQFNYSPLIWMFCKKTYYLKIEKIHYKTLKVIYNCNDSYEELLNRSRSLSIHQRHLHFLLTEIYKSINN